MVIVRIPWEDSKEEIITIGCNLVDDRSIIKVLQSPHAHYDEFYDEDGDNLPEFHWLTTDFGDIVRKLHSNILWFSNGEAPYAEYNIDSRDHKLGNWVPLHNEG